MFTRSKDKHKPINIQTYNSDWVLTNTILKSYKNSEHIKLESVVCSKGTFTVRETDHPQHKTHLCPIQDKAYKTTFVKYLRMDGKFEETRLDKLHQVKYLY